MSIYHLSLKPISRSSGQTATAAAAYRSASVIADQRTGEIFDFSRKQGVVNSELVMPNGCDWKPSRSELWNRAELAEKRKDACVAREHEIALPKEMGDAQRLALVQSYAADLAERHGCAVDFSIHAPRPNAKGGEENHHAHVMCSTRKVNAGGLGEKCDREKAGRNRKEDLKEERKRWEEICNQHLKQAGIDQQVDCRSLVDQGITNRPPGQHLGPAAAAINRKPSKEKTNGKRNQQHPENSEPRRRNPPPPRRGRLLPLSQCPVVSCQGNGRPMLLSDDVFHRLEQRRAEYNNGMRRPSQSRRGEHIEAEEKEQQSRAAARQEKEEARAKDAGARLRRRITQEPSRIYGGEGKESQWLRLGGLHQEQRSGRTVWRFSKTNIAAVIDHGDSLSITKLSDSRVGAAIQIAREKGWKSLLLTGSDEFKRKAVLAALEAGLRIENPELQEQVKQIKAEQEKARAPAAEAWQPPAFEEVKAVALPPRQPAAPADLGRRAAEVDRLLAEQEKAEQRLRSLPGFAEAKSKEATLSKALAEARQRQREGVKDDSLTREIFSVHSTKKLADRLDKAQQDEKAARAALAKLEGENPVRRFLSSGERKQLAERIKAARQVAGRAASEIERVEDVYRKMADPKARAAYRSWAIARIAERNADVDDLEKRFAAVQAERRAQERKAGVDGEAVRHLEAERQRIAEAANRLTALDRERFERARAGRRSEEAGPPPTPTPAPTPRRPATKGPGL